jgi:hypothetical protein
MLLVRLAFLESEVRSEILEDGRLARVHVFANRLPRMHRAGWEGKKSTSGMAFAWFVWERDHHGAAKIDRVKMTRCAACDEWFVARSDAKTCSDRCRQKAHRQRVTTKPRKSA